MSSCDEEEVDLRLQLVSTQAMLDAAYALVGKQTLVAERRLERLEEVSLEAANLNRFVLELRMLIGKSRQTNTMAGWLSADALEELIENRLELRPGGLTIGEVVEAADGQ